MVSGVVVRPGRSSAGIAASNPADRTDVRPLCLSYCVGSGL